MKVIINEYDNYWWDLADSEVFMFDQVHVDTPTIFSVMSIRPFVFGWLMVGQVTEEDKPKKNIYVYQFIYSRFTSSLLF